jgi:hypothetical protein
MHGINPLTNFKNKQQFNYQSLLQLMLEAGNKNASNITVNYETINNMSAGQDKIRADKSTG